MADNNQELNDISIQDIEEQQQEKETKTLKNQKEFDLSKAIKEKFNEIDARLDEFDKEQAMQGIEEQGGEVKTKSSFSFLAVIIAVIAFGYLIVKFVKNRKSIQQQSEVKISDIKSDDVLSSAFKG